MRVQHQVAEQSQQHQLQANAAATAEDRTPTAAWTLRSAGLTPAQLRAPPSGTTATGPSSTPRWFFPVPSTSPTAQPPGAATAQPYDAEVVGNWRGNWHGSVARAREEPVAAAAGPSSSPSLYSPTPRETPSSSLPRQRRSPGATAAATTVTEADAAREDWQRSTVQSIRKRISQYEKVSALPGVYPFHACVLISSPLHHTVWNVVCIHDDVAVYICVSSTE